MTFSEATKKQAGVLMKAVGASLLSQWPSVRLELSDQAPFRNYSEAEQAALFEAAKKYLRQHVRNRVNPKLVSSPYRFVPLNETVEKTSPIHRSQPKNNGVSGQIVVEWVIETPILIGQTIREQKFDEDTVAALIAKSAFKPDAAKVAIPMAFAPGEFVIPGATFKGLIRSILQIIMFGRLGDINRHQPAGPRNAGDVIRDFHPEHVPPKSISGFEPDRVESLLGFLLSLDGETDSSALGQKSRAGFGFATLVDPSSARIGRLHEAVMMGPKPSFGPFYLAGSEAGSPIGWQETGCRLAGRKRYFPQFEARDLRKASDLIADAAKQSIPKKVGRNSLCWMAFLEPSTPGHEIVFRSKIRFHNAVASEIGAVLWALTFGGQCEPEKPFRHMIGRGKPFGAGQARVRNIDLGGLKAHGPIGERLIKPAEPWETQTPTREGWIRPDQRSLGPFLRAFDEIIRRKRGDNWSKGLDIAGLLDTASLAAGASRARVGLARYPAMTDFKLIADAVKSDATLGDVNPFTPERLLGAGAGVAQRPYNTPDKV